MLYHTVLVFSWFAFIGSATLFRLVSLEKSRQLRDVWIVSLGIAIVSLVGFAFGTWKTAAGSPDVAVSIAALLIGTLISLGFSCYRSTTKIGEIKGRLAQLDLEIRLHNYIAAHSDYHRALYDFVTHKESGR